jgi:amidase
VLGDFDAVGVAALIRSGAISAREAVDAAIARAQRVNPELNFLVTDCFERARGQAASVQEGPFAGVPTLIKDLTALAGVRLTYGSRAFADFVPQTSAPYARALLASGLAPIGKSSTPEFGFTATTEPLFSGPTLNPWNPAHSCGGSSGGAAAAVAAGVTPAAHASDGGGSIRIPASTCGLVGLKPSRGRCIGAGADSGPIDISVDGCVSRTVRDTAVWLAATEQTGAGARLSPIGVVAGPSQRRLRIGLAIPDALGRDPDPDVRDVIEATGLLCEGLGHRVQPIALPIDGPAFQEAFTLYWAAGAAQTAAGVRERAPGVALETLLEPLTLQLAALWQAQPRDAMERIVSVLRGSEASYDALFETIDVLLTPVLARPAPVIGEIAPTLPFEIGFARVQTYVGYTPLQNVAGSPAISLPLGMSRSGLPIGAHFAARIGAERTLLELAYELEIAAPWSARRPRIWAG